jgi:site-specific recombinase XerD
MQTIDAINLLRDTCALQHLSINTEKSYSHWLRRFIGFLQQPSSKSLSTSEEKIEAFLTSLALTGMSASTQNQAFNGLLFFYRFVLKQQLESIEALRAKRPPGLRHCPERTEMTALLEQVADAHRYPTRLIVHLIYGCGLRVCEPLNLRIKDLDLVRHRLHIHQAKGNCGRVVLFPECLLPALERQLAVARAVAAQDLHDNIPVALPGLLAKKFPYAARSERWAWLFPSHSTCFDRRARIHVRWRCHESNVQRAVRDAADKCKLRGITPHLLRHAFATHSLHDGTYVRDLQVVLGHKHLETTMLYLHAEVGRVVSPLRGYTPDAAPSQQRVGV